MRGNVWQGEVFSALATMLSAGMSPLEAVRALSRQYAGLTVDLVQVQQRLKKGASLTDSLSVLCLFRLTELEILRAGETAGQVPDSLRFIASRFDKRINRLRKIKGKLILPGAIFVVAVISGFILKLVRSESTAGPAVLQAGVYILMAWVVMKGVFRLLQMDAIQLSGLIENYRLPFTPVLLKRSFELTWLRVMLWLYNSGVDWVTTFRRLASLSPGQSFQKKMAGCASRVKNGESVSSVLTSEGLPLSRGLKNALITGDSSGRLYDSLQHYTDLQEQHTDLDLDSFTDWLPRICYAVIVCFVVVQVLP